MFITLEGIEGSGKTTQLAHIRAFLESKGHDCIVTREPGGTDIGRQIRAILLSPENHGMDPVAELLLYFADRAQHVRSLVLPALSSGKTVLCDRYFDATVVYQGYARRLDIGLIEKLHRLVLDDLKPDLTLLLDLPAEAGLSRAWRQIENGSRTGVETRFEEEALSFHKSVRAGYLELARNEPSRFRVIDASRDQERVARDIIDVLSSTEPPT